VPHAGVVVGMTAPTDPGHYQRPALIVSEPTAGELGRMVATIERKADRALREIDGEGANLGVRGMCADLQRSVRALDQDLGAQRRELFEALHAMRDEIVARVALETVTPQWQRLVYIMCAITSAASLLYVAFRAGE
jgi:hypothetical protein